MAESIAIIVVYAFHAYAALGLLFGIVFVWRGVQKMDQQATGTSFAFRCLILPGTIAFWPLLLRRWLRATGEPPTEEKPHR